jgi:hypothetical protein
MVKSHRPLENDMTITGTVKNGEIVPDEPHSWPEGSRVILSLDTGEANEWPEFDVSGLPPDHPMAPYNREVEIALLRESIAEAEAGYPGRPLEEVMAELSAKHGLSPMEVERP